MSKLKGTYTFSDVTEGHTISVEFENMVVGRFEYDSNQFTAVKYRIGTSGSFIPVANNQTIDIPLGSTLYFEITEAAGIDISNWQAIFEEDQVSEYKSGTGLTGSFDVPSDDFFIRINAVSENYEVGIAASPAAGGTVSPTSLTLPYGTTIVQNASYPNRIYFRLPGTGGEQQASATAKIGYEFDHWSDTSGTITAAKTITAYFTKKSYTSTVKMYADGAESTTCGTVSVSNTTQSKSGTSVSHVSGDTLVYSATANAGYEFDHWSTNPTSSTVTSKNNPYTKASAPAANMTLYAVFNKLPSIDLTFNTDGNGGLDKSSYTYVGTSASVSAVGNALKIGNTTIVTDTPASGYKLAYWETESGDKIGPGGDAVSISQSTTITAVHAQIVYAVTVIPSGCTVDMESLTVPQGATFTTSTSGTLTFSDGTVVTATPLEGYYSTVTWSPTKSSSPITSDGTVIRATCSKKQFMVKVAVKDGVGGSASITYNSQTKTTDTSSTVGISVTYGDKPTIVATPKSGYEFDGWYENDMLLYTTATVTPTIIVAHTFHVKFKLIQYKITATAGSGGTISPSGDVYVDRGSNKTFTITANSGHKIKAVKIDGTEIDLDTDPGWNDA